jgi:hypothetical protein
MNEARRLIEFVARVQRLLRALSEVSDPAVRQLTEGLVTEARWAMWLADRLLQEVDDGR